MIRKTRAIWLGALIGVISFNQPSIAAPTLTGSTGLIKIPTAEVFSEGEVVLGFSWIGGERSYLFRPQPNRMYFASCGLLPGLELSLDMLQVIGWVDPDAPGVAWAIHRLSNLKYRLPLPVEWPHVAVGAQDPLSANAIARGPAGQTNYGLTNYYCVVSKEIGPISVHLGYSKGQSDPKGAFGGTVLNLGYGLITQVEYDGQQWNAGMRWQPVRSLGLQVARLLPNDWAYEISLSWPL